MNPTTIQWQIAGEDRLWLVALIIRTAAIN